MDVNRNPDDCVLFENNPVKLGRLKNLGMNNWSVSCDILSGGDLLPNGNRQVSNFFMVMRASNHAMLVDITEGELQAALDYVKRLKKDGWKSSEKVLAQ